MTEQKQTNPFIWASIWFGFVLWVLMNAFAQWKNWQESYFFPGIDFDPVLRLMRVEQFMTSGDWANEIFLRLNPPEGMLVPWTYPLDMIVAGGGWILHHWMPLKDALLAWGMLLSPIMWIVFAITMLWATRPILKHDLEKIALLVLIAINNDFSQTFYLLRAADHHGLALIFMVLSLGAWLRSDRSQRWAIYAGIFCGLGFWTAIEGFMLYVISCVAMGLLWLSSGKIGILQQIRRFTLGTLLIVVPAFWIEHLREPLLVEYDRLSVLHVTWTLLALGAILLFEKLPQRLQSLPWRAAIAIAACTVIFVVLQSIFPGFYKGPMAQIPDWLKISWLARIGEMQPLLPWQAWSVLPWYALAYLAMDMRLKNHSLGDHDYSRHYWLLTFLGFLIISCMSARWLRNVEVLSTPFLAVAFVTMAHWLTKRFLSARPEWWQPSVQILLLGCMIYFYYQLPWIIEVPADFRNNFNQINNCSYGTDSLARFGKLDRYLGKAPVTFAMPENLSFDIVFWTRHNSLVANYHRNVSGFEKMRQIVAAKDETTAHQLLQQYKIGAILFCPLPPDNKPESLAANNLSLNSATWLNPDHPPVWLKRIPWPEDAPELKAVPVETRPYFFKVNN